MDYRFENKIVSEEESETENGNHCGQDTREESVIISCDAGTDIDEDCAELIIKLEQAEFSEFKVDNHDEVGKTDMCIEEETMAIKTNDSDEHIIKGDKQQEEIPHREQCNSKTEKDKIKDKKVHQVIKFMQLSDNESDDECEKSDQFGDQNVDIDIDCAKFVRGKCNFKINVFPEALVNQNVFGKKVRRTQDHDDSDSNSIRYEANLEQITYTQLNICDIETIREKHEKEEDMNPTEKYINEERECTKDKPILDLEDENNMEGDVREYLTQPITMTAVSTNVDNRKTNDQSLYKICHRQHVYLHF